MEIKKKIRRLLLKKNKKIDGITLRYYTNYFYAVTIKRVLPNDVDIEKLMDNLLKYKIVFYDENSNIFKQYGPDVKGFRDSNNKIIYVRNNLDDILKEITVYHEIHHAVQTNIENDSVGINQDENKGRLIMEAQTQYFAEGVYKLAHGVVFEERNIKSEDVRLYKGGTIVSKLHNYELYDSLLTKLAIVLNVSKNFFVSINYYCDDDKGLKILERCYNKAKEKYNLSYTFNEIMVMLDRIYVTDLFLYSNEDMDSKNALLNDRTLHVRLYSDLDTHISRKIEWDDIKNFDIELFLDLVQNNGNSSEFAKYITSNERRKIAFKYTNLGDNPSSGNSRK